jgi:hypothetical protein
MHVTAVQVGTGDDGSGAGDGGADRISCRPGPGVVLLVKVVVHYCWGGFFVCAMPHPFYPEISLFQNEN